MCRAFLPATIGAARAGQRQAEVRESGPYSADAVREAQHGEAEGQGSPRFNTCVTRALLTLRRRASAAPALDVPVTQRSDLLDQNLEEFSSTRGWSTTGQNLLLVKRHL
jgi:hypothetical protein